jgi:hypothetical protein
MHVLLNNVLNSDYGSREDILYIFQTQAIENSGIDNACRVYTIKIFAYVILPIFKSLKKSYPLIFIIESNL